MAINLGGTWASLGSALGQGVNQGVSQSLDLLRDQKLRDLDIARNLQYQQALMGLQSQQQQSEAQKMMGALAPIYGQQGAELLAALDPASRKYALQNPEALMQLSQMQEPQPRGLQALSSMEGVTPSAMPQSGLQALQSPQEINQPQAQGLQALQQPTQRQKVLSELFKSPESRRREQELALKEKSLGLRAEIAKQKAQFGENKENLRQIERAWDKIEPDLREFDKYKKESRRTLEDIERMEELEGTPDNPKLPTTATMLFFKNWGMDEEDAAAFLQNPDAQEFGKIKANFLRNLKNIFGARVSNQEMENYLKALPRLLNDPEGRKRIYANLKRIARGQQAYSKAADKVLDKYGERPPQAHKFRSLVEKEVDKELNTIAKQFREDLKKKVPDTSSTLANIAATTAGSTLKTIGDVGKSSGGLLRDALLLGSLYKSPAILQNLKNIAPLIAGSMGGPLGLAAGAGLALGGLAGARKALHDNQNTSHNTSEIMKLLSSQDIPGGMIRKFGALD